MVDATLLLWRGPCYPKTPGSRLTPPHSIDFNNTLSPRPISYPRSPPKPPCSRTGQASGAAYLVPYTRSGPGATKTAGLLKIAKFALRCDIWSRPYKPKSSGFVRPWSVPAQPRANRSYRAVLARAGHALGYSFTAHCLELETRRLSSHRSSASRPRRCR